MNRHDRRAEKARQKSDGKSTEEGPASKNDGDNAMPHSVATPAQEASIFDVHADDAATAKRLDARPRLDAANFCLGFVDLLGLRDAMRGQLIMPTITTEEEREEFRTVVRNSIGRIYGLQRRAEDMLATLLESVADPSFKSGLPPEQLAIWDQMNFTKVANQRWSDGLVYFSGLRESGMKCRMNGLISIFWLCGALCLLGIGEGQPIRGAISVGWGVELFPDEIYGPVVARAYELESRVAQYPRVVIGAEVVSLLEVFSKRPGDDPYAQLDRTLARNCLAMVIKDGDGQFILHYLGAYFRDAVTQYSHGHLYESGRAFIERELARFISAGDPKLAGRYALLFEYFKRHKPVAGGTEHV